MEWKESVRSKSPHFSEHLHGKWREKSNSENRILAERGIIHLLLNWNTHTHKFNTCNEYFCGKFSCIFLSAIALSHSRYVGPSFNVTLLKMQNCTENSSILLTFIQSLVLADSAVSNWQKCHTTTGKAHSKVGKTGKVKKAKRKLIEQLSGRVSAWTPEQATKDTKVWTWKVAYWRCRSFIFFVFPPFIYHIPLYIAYTYIITTV